MSIKKLTHFAFILCMGIAPVLTGCSEKQKTPGLVSTSVMGSRRGKHFVRIATHFHTPYSFDACDGKGYRSDGSIDLNCLQDARDAICANHLNFVFATDHENHMAEVEMLTLLATQSGDTVLYNGASEPIGNQIQCPDGFQAVLVPGLEGRLLALGMERHVSPTLSVRQDTYSAESVAAKTSLENDADALVGVPHTESRTLSDLITLAPSFIEIYNVHANLDPKIRKKYLGRKPFDKIGKFLNYIADPYKELYADYIFADFVEMSPVYFRTWNQMVNAGLHVTGVGGLDSHENIFSQKGSDGLRLDHHRRMTRFMNNLVLTATDTSTAVKTEINAGSVYFIIEGFGTPIGLDYYGDVAGTTVEMGRTMTVGAGQASSITAIIPSVHGDFPGMDSDDDPEIWAELIFVDSNSNESVVARAYGAGAHISYADPPEGHYRVHYYMKPRHLKEYLFNEEHLEETYTWIITNFIKVDR